MSIYYILPICAIIVNIINILCHCWTALLRLDKEVKFTNRLKPVCLPTRGKSFSHLDVCIRFCFSSLFSNTIWIKIDFFLISNRASQLVGEHWKVFPFVNNCPLLVYYYRSNQAYIYIEIICNISEQGDISATLQEVVVPILSNNECRQTGYGASRITDNMLCAGFKDGEKDSCQVKYQ